MAASPHSPNQAFRRLRAQHSPAEFAAMVRRAAREIGETVSCDARYIGRVESGEIRCPNYAYERVFLHMFPGLTLADLGFSPREAVRGRSAQRPPAPPVFTHLTHLTHRSKESDVLRRAFMAGGSATVAAATLGLTLLGDSRRLPSRAGESEAAAVEDAVRQIRLLDDRHGADALYQRAAEPLRTAYALLDAGATRQSTEDRLHAGAGELAVSVGWLAHDSGRFEDARSHYAEALATARVAGDAGLEAHAFSNMAFLARDCGRPREAVRAAQAGRRAARSLGSPRLLSLLALREAGGWAGLADRRACEEALTRAHTDFSRGDAAADPEWMSFFGEAELESLEARCWAALGEHARAARHARRAADLQDPHFARNVALYTAELADNLARAGAPDEAAWAGGRVLDLLTEVQSTRIESMLSATARTLVPHQRSPRVGAFLSRQAAV
ncbi:MULTISPECIES: tetratricopeptide repeat protein [unclassified Streptomyces]|uniref:tetratricopeptide repeat protein n=1 Tax=unclassified Streptomyces TaxID=2593676 RepID=UPI001BEB434C|nr:MULTISPECIES: tetratricopeptide repeat protein [unclassified Streptomyces]MBT2402613.1 tetratricopeptide repeat protein [Streptomyces sp. ISL-21]MBT2457213.1 tetratricopeptide repeat protein [Streptomyces sp. ISL-86]MBT2608006.1 tetratricopeptide repeat protein [Streptomyces sp. ISL-87]